MFSPLSRRTWWLALKGKTSQGKTARDREGNPRASCCLLLPSLDSQISFRGIRSSPGTSTRYVPCWRRATANLAELRESHARSRPRSARHRLSRRNRPAQHFSNDACQSVPFPLLALICCLNISLPEQHTLANREERSSARVKRFVISPGPPPRSSTFRPKSADHPARKECERGEGDRSDWEYPFHALIAAYMRWVSSLSPSVGCSGWSGGRSSAR